MYIQSFRLVNFKSFKNSVFHLNEDINLLTGLNNSGKTTVLEALALWHELFTKMIEQQGRTKKKRDGVNIGDYFIAQLAWYFSHHDIECVRITNQNELFHNLDDSQGIELEASLINDNEEKLSIGFRINYSKGNRLSVQLIQQLDIPLFNRFFSGYFPTPINQIYASPVAFIRKLESFETNPRIQRLVSERESAVVLRNRLYNLRTRGNTDWSNYENDLSFVLAGEPNQVSFEFTGDKNSDVEIAVRVSVGNKRIMTELSQMGSGTVQIIEILLAIYERKAAFTLVLLDEPDSHIHRDIQKRLLQTLTDRSSGNQIVLTSHNESLIRSTPPSQVFHVTGAEQSAYYPIIHGYKPKAGGRGFKATPQLKVLQSLGYESTLDFLNAVEADIIFIVEGNTDAYYIDYILNNKYNNRKVRAMYWTCSSLSVMFDRINFYKELFTSIKNKKTLWEKSVLVFDKDFITESQRKKLAARIQKDYKIKTHIWRSRTFEATLLSEPDKFERMLEGFLKTKVKSGSVDLGFLRKTIFNESSILCKIKYQYIKDFNDKGLLKDEIDRVKNLIGEMGIKDVFQGKDGSFAPQFFNEITIDIEAGRLNQIADKDDVAQLIRAICTEFGVTSLPDDINEYFEELVAPIKHDWYKEWDELISLIES
ncbi:MAG: AAA family ATPase [Bacteroidetes bacterium]|nr:AAA family ATPase [Bacteroidota bacterium]